MVQTQHSFAGAIPEKYDTYLGPILFEPYAKELAGRVPNKGLRDVLELACGTGILTRHLRQRLPGECKLVATDLSEAMLEIAKRKADYAGPIDWRAVDATELPFDSNSFDHVVCQFGVMFFPDKAAAAREVLRVLRPGGSFLFNVWDSLDHNDFGRVARETIVPLFANDPPEFYNVPFGFHDQGQLRSLLKDAGFVDVALEVVPMASVAQSARHVAAGFVEGNPISVEIQERLGTAPTEVVDAVEKAVARAYGDQAPIKARMQAIVVSGRKA